MSDPKKEPPEHVAQVNQFNRDHRLDGRIAYGYKDGGRQAQYDEDSGKTIIRSKRETIVFKSPDEDPVLKRTIEKAKADMAGMTSTAQKAQYLSAYIDKLMPKVHDNDAIIDRIVPPYAAQRQISLGQLIEAETGVCRHRSLLFKVLADETGVPASLVRGHFNDGHSAGSHAWNEVQLENGKKIIVDVMHQNTFQMGQPGAHHYNTVARHPMYNDNGPIQRTPQSAPPQSAPNRVIGGLDHAIINSAEQIHTTKGLYLSIEGLPPYKTDALKQSLNRQGIVFEEKRSNVNGGTNVLALDTENAHRLAKFQGGDPLPLRPPSPPVQATPSQPAPAQPAQAQPASRPAAPVADDEQRIRLNPQQAKAMRDYIAIASAETIHSSKGLYLSVEGKSPDQINALKQSLQNQGIEFRDHRSSVNGGTNVLALDDSNAAKFTKAQNSPPSLTRDPHAAPPTAAKPDDHAIRLTPQEAAQLRDHATISNASVIETTKGKYLSIEGKSPEYVADLKQSLARQNIQFDEKTSGINGGTRVLSLDSENAAKFVKIQTSADASAQSPRTQFGSPAAAATPPPSQAPAAAAPAPSPAQPSPAQPAAAAAPAPAAPTASAASATPATPSATKSERPATPPTPAADQTSSVKKPAADVSEHHGPRTSSSGAAHISGAKVDGAAGKLGTAVQAAAKVAEGDNVGAAKVVAEAVGTKFAITQLAKKIPVIGAVVTVGTTLWAAGAQAAQGNYGKAAAELAAGGAEAAGNVVGFGAGDAAREVVRAGVQVAAGDKYAPEKSGLRQMAETAVDVAKKVGSKGSAQEPFNKASSSNPSAPSVAIVNPAQYRGQSTAQLADTIQKDPVLPDTVKMGNKDVKLCDALKDKTFRTTFLQSLESAAAKGVDVGQQVAMIKAYEQKIDPPSTAVAATSAPKRDVTASASPPPRRQGATLSDMGPMA